MVFVDDDDEALQQKAVDFGKSMRDCFDPQGRFSAYINYAMGDEDPRAWYGYEQWRLEKLSALKSKWDPDGRFSFYAPIPLDSSDWKK